MSETNRTQVTRSVDSSLRTRIAAAIESESMRYLSYNEACAMADAVIAELGLQREWSAIDDDGSGVEYRYVTDWKADDE